MAADLIALARALRVPIDTNLGSRKKPAESIDSTTTAVIAAMAGPLTASVDPQIVMAFIAGAIDHQRNVHDAGSKVFSAELADVTRIERKSNGRTLGHKVSLTFKSTNKKGESQDEEITTHWVEFMGNSDPAKVRDPRHAWDLAFSASIEEDAKALIGKKVYVRKAFLLDQDNGQGGHPRYIAHIEGSWGDAGDKGASSSRGDRVSVRDIEDAFKRAGYEYRDYLDDLEKVKDWAAPDTELIDEVSDAIRLSNDEVADFRDRLATASGGTELDRVASALGWTLRLRSL